MKALLELWLVAAISTQFLCAQQTGSWGDQGDGTYKNPILEANYPDNDVIRDGDTFYMMSSTCEFVPGMIILKSKDLVNWEISNHIMPAPIRFDRNFDINQPKLISSRGTWAGSLGFNGEDYFAYWCYNQRHKKPGGTHKIFFAKAKSMEGPWSTPRELTWPDGTHINTTDPGVFFDLDTKKAWMALWLKGTVKLFPMTWDGETLLADQKDGILITKEYEGEAVKMCKHDGMYYIMNAHVGEHDGEKQRNAFMLRAKNIEGPWEGKMVLENGNGCDRSPSQGALLKLDDGSWWFLHQLAWGTPQERYNGRPQFLEPVTWGKDGWPIIGIDTDGDGIGEVVWQHRKPIQGLPVNAPATDDDFNHPTLGKQWYWRFNPDLDRISLSKRPGFLRMKSCAASKSNTNKASLGGMPNLIMQRSMGRHGNVMTAKVDLGGMVEGQEVGFHISATENHVIGVVKAHDGETRLFFKTGKFQKLTVNGGPTIEQTELWFRTTIENGLANFYYSLDGKTFTGLGTEVHLTFSGFRTNAVGFYSRHADEKGHMDIDWFTYDYDGPKGRKEPKSSINSSTQ